MSPTVRATTLLFSICLHGGLCGILYCFSGNILAEEETVYHVALAEFTPVQPEVSAPPQPEIPMPSPEPEPEIQPEPEPKVEPVKETPPPREEVKRISPKKKEPSKVRPKPTPKPTPKSPPEKTFSKTESAEKVSGGGQVVAPTVIGGIPTYKQDQIDQRPSIARRVTPEYPIKARRMNIHGKVLVQLIVDTSGLPRDCKVVRASPQGYFEDSALTAAKKMKFIPGKLKGKTVNTLVIIPFSFSIK